MTPRPFRVRQMAAETADTFTMQIEPVFEADRFAFAPGQFNMLYAFGVGEVPVSISGKPDGSGPLVHTIRAVGKATAALCTLKKGEVLGVRGPFGTAWPVDVAQGCDVIVVAGGIGLAPLRPVIYHLLEHRANYARIALLYGTRTPQDLLYVKQLEEWRSRFDMEVGITVDRATPEWHGNVGVVTRLLARAVYDPGNSVAMVCGPEIMMRFTVMELQRRGMSDARIFVSLERSMKCGIGLCGHCQCGPVFVCKDGPVYAHSRVAGWLRKREI